jgi:hypothetical protein
MGKSPPFILPTRNLSIYTPNMPHRTQIKADKQGSELLSSFVARQVMIYAFKVDVTAIGLDEMREYPELGSSHPSQFNLSTELILVPACGMIPLSTAEI